jgi:hypothetical protein
MSDPKIVVVRIFTVDVTPDISKWLGAFPGNTQAATNWNRITNRRRVSDWEDGTTLSALVGQLADCPES